MSQHLTLPEGHEVEFEYYRTRAWISSTPKQEGEHDPSGKDVARYNYVEAEIPYELHVKGVSNWQPGSNGGEVICYIYNQCNVVVSCGHSTCHWKDNFNPRIGRAISFGRALKRMQGQDKCT